MKLKFDANQQFQIDAIASVVGLFEGQPETGHQFAPVQVGPADGLFSGQASTELGVGNHLMLDDHILRENTRHIQDRNLIDLDNPEQELEGWAHFDEAANERRVIPHFSVEMETGTGKTYVYLRTIFELSKRFGFKKYVIVVPSVAIREGVLKSIELTAEHFNALYGEAPQAFVYDSKRLSRLREFATANTLQIQIINIQAFAKNVTGDEATRLSNVIYKESDKLSGRQPIEFVKAARPIVIIDEPQSVDSRERSQEAIRALNPLVTLRYSATHRNPYNLVYRLDPIQAFEMRLVKQIVVASATVDALATDAFVRLEGVSIAGRPIAKLAIQVQTPTGPKRKTVTAAVQTDLHVLSNERAEYADGYAISEIYAEPGREYVLFANGVRLQVGAELGGVRAEIWRAQIKHTIRRHLETELTLAGRGIKVLSLFFVDRVANYRAYGDDGGVEPGKFAAFFETELRALLARPEYQALPWAKAPIETLHNGYFAQDKKGVLKDTRGDTAADDDAYDLIMKDKERLLALDTPLRFIFSHSALREGWDNPNVFQICTLNETASPMKKRQEIGRGLRLPVDQNGERVFDDSINKLYVMANESYEDFAKGLQTEYEDDCGVTFGKVPLAAFARLTRIVDETEVPIGREAAASLRDALVAHGMLTEGGQITPAFRPASAGFVINLQAELDDLKTQVIDLLSAYQIERHVRRERDERQNPLKKQVLLDADFMALWDRIKARTTYRVEFETDDLVRLAVAAVKAMPRVEKPRIEIKAGTIRVGRGGVTGSTVGVAEERIDYGSRPIPDILSYLQASTDLTRSTIARILTESLRLPEFFNDPQRFMDSVVAAVQGVLRGLVVDGVKYVRLGTEDRNSEWEMREFASEELANVLTALAVKKSVYEYIGYDSDVERRFAEELDGREDIRLFLKLPRWFTIETPVGKYNPDWAILKVDGEALYLARETKSTHDFMKLRNTEALKVRCGFKHFEALGVDFDVVTNASEV